VMSVPGRKMAKPRRSDECCHCSDCPVANFQMLVTVRVYLERRGDTGTDIMIRVDRRMSTMSDGDPRKSHRESFIMIGQST
jgi:hypothetical protein